MGGNKNMSGEAVWRYSEEHGKWRRVVAQSTGYNEKQELTVVTLNQWFSGFQIKSRCEKQIELLKEHNPDVICLQETITTSLWLFCRDPWIQQTYYCSDAAGDTIGDSYGVIMFFKTIPQRIELAELPTNMGRSFLYAEFMWNNETVAIGTVHLESLNSRPIRQKQLLEIRHILQSFDHKIFCGDFNFDSHKNFDPRDPRALENDWMKRHLNEYTDTWDRLRPRENGYTFDTTRNLMLANHSPERMRYDRVMYSSNRWEPVSIELLGDAPIGEAFPGDIFNGKMLTNKLKVFVSDHFGLISKFQYAD